MIPEQFKQNISLDIQVYGHPVKADYKFYWPEYRGPGGPDPLISHIEFRAGSDIISETGYHSHFFHAQAIADSEFQDITELVTSIAETLAREQGYEPPAPNRQLRLF